MFPPDVFLVYMVAVLTIVIFTLPGSFAARLSAWLAQRPRAVALSNVGAGITFVSAGLSILALGHRR